MSVSSHAARMPPEPEDPGIVAANLNVGVRLLASALAFVFVAFVFAFFYLKAVNSFGNWRPGHVKPSQGYGIAILLCVVGTTVSFELARRMRARPGPAWRIGVAVALALSIAAFVLQIVEYSSLGFGAPDGGYASVFYGWTAMFLVAWLGSIYWVETLLATTLRGLPETDEVAGGALELLRPSADACSIYLYLTAGVAIVAYVLLYLVK